MQRRTMCGAVVVVTVLVMLFTTVLSAAAELAESETRQSSITLSNSGNYFGSTSPEYMLATFPNEWSTEAAFDLTNVPGIPSSAVVTGININANQTSGNFARPKIAVFDKNGHGFYVHDLTRSTNLHNGKSVQQRWTVAFHTSTIWQGPARIWPYVTIFYEY